MFDLPQRKTIIHGKSRLNRSRFSHVMTFATFTGIETPCIALSCSGHLSLAAFGRPTVAAAPYATRRIPQSPVLP